jgi:hypothetical protein
MSAKITLIGQPQNLHVEKDIATFKIVTGPASNSAPKGLDLFKPVTYLVQCSQRQLNRGRAGTDDHSELIIEGYLEPRLGPDGKLFIAVVGLSVASKQQQNERKLTQLRDEVTKAEEIYDRACTDSGLDSPQAKAALADFERLKGNLLKFMSSRSAEKAG